MKRGKGFRFQLIALAFLLITALMVCGCAKKTEEPSTDKTVSSEQKVLKVGAICFFGWPLGVDMAHGLEIQTDLINKAGGLDIGGEKYRIEPIIYDSNGDPATAVACANKLIFEDKVKYILADSLFVDAWLPITEKNKVIVCAGVSSPGILNPDYHYSFQTGFLNSQVLQMASWWSKNYPDKKNIVVALPDSQDGHNYSIVYKLALNSFGINVTELFYPASAQDLSSLGTRVKKLNPDAFEATGGGMSDTMAYKAVRQAGYTGQIIANGTATSEGWAKMVGTAEVEGMISGAWATEFEPAKNETARIFKEAYAAKYGQWDGPEVMFTANWECLKTALEKSGSTDPEKIAETIGSGLSFESVTGPARMVSRPDMGNNRTIDSVNTYYVKKTVNGHAELIDVIQIDDAVVNFQSIYK